MTEADCPPWHGEPCLISWRKKKRRRTPEKEGIYQQITLIAAQLFPRFPVCQLLGRFWTFQPLQFVNQILEINLSPNLYLYLYQYIYLHLSLYIHIYISMCILILHQCSLILNIFHVLIDNLYLFFYEVSAKII